MPVITPSTVSILPPTQTSGGSLKEKANAFRYNSQDSKDAALWSTAAEAFANVQSQVDHLSNALRSPIPQPQVIQITDPAGALVAEIGNLIGSNNQAYPGIWGRNLYVGGTGPDTAPFFANGQEVFVGNGGQIFVVDTSNNVGAWLGYQQEAPKAVTGAVNNGSGNVRLTVTAHGYVNGDNVLIKNVGGVPGANQSMGIVKVITANTFDLVGSVFSGTYTSGGTSTRFFSGGLFAAMAIGGSKIITNIANNGSGLVRVTVPAHGYSTGYAAIITDTTGIPNLNYTSWLVTVIDADTFDLQGSVFSGAYDGNGGQALNWPTSKLIAYDDGSLVINGATLILSANGVLTTINNATGPSGSGQSISSLDISIINGGFTAMSPYLFAAYGYNSVALAYQPSAQLINSGGRGELLLANLPAGGTFQILANTGGAGAPRIDVLDASTSNTTTINQNGYRATDGASSDSSVLGPFALVFDHGISQVLSIGQGAGAASVQLTNTANSNLISLHTGGAGAPRIDISDGTNTLTLQATTTFGAPGGSNTDVQYNNGVGGFAGNGFLTFNGVVLSAFSINVSNGITTSGMTVTSSGIDVTGSSSFHTGIQLTAGSFVQSGGGQISSGAGGFNYAGSSPGFTGGPAAYTNFTFKGGLCTNAS